MSATAISPCPTPTVSTITTSKPAASHRRSVSRVRRATPPGESALGDGRMNAFGSTASRAMRVLSPRIEPPDSALDGSIASTATRSPFSVSRLPSSSMKVLLPTPGTPVTPSRRAPPVAGKRRVRSACASAPSCSSRLSMSVIACAKIARSAARTPRSYSSRERRALIPALRACRAARAPRPR